MGSQLFLWTVRHIVYGVNENQAVCEQIQQTFDATGLPCVPTLVHDLLGTMSNGASRPVLINLPNGIELLDDERALICCLETLQETPARCGCRYLQDFIEPETMENVMRRFSFLANVMAQHLNDCRQRRQITISKPIAAEAPRVLH